MKTRSTHPDLATTDGIAAFNACHVEIIEQLGELSRFVANLPECGRDEGSPALAGKLIAFFSGPAREHNEDEERFLFPSILRGDDLKVTAAVQLLAEDHAWIELHWLDVEAELKKLIQGSGECDKDLLHASVDALVSLTRQHIELEDSLVYPELRERLEPESLHAMRREMAARRKRRLHSPRVVA